jgi:hypothetical protein
MKTKKLLYTGCFMAASMLSLTSCGDFLDEDPKGQLNPDTFYTIEDDYTAGVNTLYPMNLSFMVRSQLLVLLTHVLSSRKVKLSVHSTDSSGLE